MNQLQVPARWMGQLTSSCIQANISWQPSYSLQPCPGENKKAEIYKSHSQESIGIMRQIYLAFYMRLSVNNLLVERTKRLKEDRSTGLGKNKNKLYYAETSEKRNAVH